MKRRNFIANPEIAGTHKRKPYLIIEGGVDMTPQRLHDPMYPATAGQDITETLALKRLHNVASGRPRDSTYSQSILMSRRSSTVRESINSKLTNNTTPSLGTFAFEKDEESEYSRSSAPSMFRLREDPTPRDVPVETEFSTTLTESETIVLLQIPSSADVVDTDGGKAIAEDNERYTQNTRESKTKSDTATQTACLVSTNRKLWVDRPKRSNADAYATVWDIYDSFRSGSQAADDDALNEDKVSDSFQYEGYTFDSRLINALMITERIILQNIYREKQMLYTGTMVQDPLSTAVEYNYTLTPLWTFKSEQTARRKVTSLCWSSANHDVLAVGYGKLKYTDKCDGLVCVWNVKNPRVPERLFRFPDPVTYVQFCPAKPHIVVVSFYSGLVILMDVTRRTLVVRATNASYPLYYPVWQVCWDSTVEDASQGLSLLTCNKNGAIDRYTESNFFLREKLMTVARPYGNIQGVQQHRKCYARKAQSTSNLSAEVLTPHPHDPLLYVVGTSEGYVYTCSLNDRHNYKDVFVAHNGPVYAVRFSPFCSKVFLTCGADWCVRVWAEGIYEPLLTLESGMTTVQDAHWSQTNSTIIVNITDKWIQLWDVYRNVLSPKSSTESPSKSINTVLEFTKNKFNLCVGDNSGNVHVLAITEMPFCCNFQDEVLVHAIQNMLMSKPKLLAQLARLGPPFSTVISLANSS